MALVNAYMTYDDLRDYVGIADNFEQSRLVNAGNAACRGIDDYCGRRFFKDTSATAKLYPNPSIADVLRVHDFWDLASLVVSDSGALTVDVAFQVEPSGLNLQEGFPYTGIRPLSHWWLSTTYPGQTSISVTAKWGWSAVPEPIRQASLMVAADIYKRKDAPFGVAGFGEFGALRVSRDVLSQAESLLSPYRRYDTAIGVA